MQRANTDLRTDHQSLEIAYKQLNEKSGRLCDQDNNIRKLQSDLEVTLTTKKELHLQNSRLCEAKSELERANESLRRQIDLLNQDKCFLSRENTNQEDKVRRCEDKIDKLEQACLEAKKQAEKYMDRVINTNDDGKTKFETQYTKENQELKDRQQKEMQHAKQNLMDVYERKVEYLRERKDEQERRIHKLEADLKDKSKNYEEMLLEFRSLQKTGDQELGMLKLDVRAKADQVTRITHLYEDNLILVKETKLENEALKAKMDILKSEYYKLESTAR